MRKNVLFGDRPTPIEETKVYFLKYLHVVLPKVPLARVVGHLERLDGLGLGDRDQARQARGH